MKQGCVLWVPVCVHVHKQQSVNQVPSAHENLEMKLQKHGKLTLDCLFLLLEALYTCSYCIGRNKLFPLLGAVEVAISTAQERRHLIATFSIKLMIVFICTVGTSCQNVDFEEAPTSKLK